MARFIRSFAIFFAVSTCLILVIFNLFDVGNIDYDSTFYMLKSARLTFTNIETKEPKNQSELLLDYCHLPNLNPWDPALAEFLDPKSDPYKNCTPTFKKLTNIVNSSIVLDSELEKYRCTYQCLQMEYDIYMKIHINYGAWILLTNGTKPPCDIVQVECRDADKHLKYEYMHALIYRNEKLLTPPDSPDMPSVHLIVLDSVSSSQFERSMVKTASYLRNNLQSQRMKYLNKIGLNSRPNAYGFLFGKGSNPIPVSSISVGHPADWPSDPCFKFLDGEPFIAFRYRDAGYVTYMTEDWDYGTFNWPNCYGFNNTPTHHYIRTYLLVYQYFELRYEDILHKNQCKDDAQDLVEYFESFLEAYKDRPSFTINWFSHLTHDDINGLYHMDDYFYKFFQRNEKYWENSYVIVMGDHGNRFHGARQTPVGDAEDNNPALWISVPKNRRTPEVLDQLEENSNKLITHYDIYATLVNLVHPKTPTHKNLTIYGEDLFGPLREPRTCDRLRIPMQYCICNFSKNVLPVNDSNAVAIAKECLRRMNQELESHPETNSSCARLSLHNNVTAESFVTNGNQNLLRVVWMTKPGTGKYSVVAITYPNGTVNILSTTFPRSTAYGHEAWCVKHSLVQSYCFCKNRYLDML